MSKINDSAICTYLRMCIHNFADTRDLPAICVSGMEPCAVLTNVQQPSTKVAVIIAHISFPRSMQYFLRFWVGFWTKNSKFFNILL